MATGRRWKAILAVDPLGVAGDEEAEEEEAVARWVGWMDARCKMSVLDDNGEEDVQTDSC